MKKYLLFTIAVTMITFSCFAQSTSYVKDESTGYKWKYDKQGASKRYEISWTGGCDYNNYMHGHGTFRCDYRDGVEGRSGIVFIYVGDMKNGVRDGFGTRYRNDYSCDYKGEWNNDDITGYGVAYDSDNEPYYAGYFRDQMIINGVQFFKNGIVQEIKNREKIGSKISKDKVKFSYNKEGFLSSYEIINDNYYVDDNNDELVAGAVILGGIALVAALLSDDDDNSSNTKDSKIYKGSNVECLRWGNGDSGYFGRVTEVSSDKYRIYIDRVKVGGLFATYLGACECTDWKNLSYKGTHHDYDMNRDLYGKGTLIWVPKYCVKKSDD